MQAAPSAWLPCSRPCVEAASKGRWSAARSTRGACRQDAAVASAGKGTNAYVTGLCTRDCFFCFNSKPRTDELVVHGIRLSEPEGASEIVRRYDLRSVGVSGGEPTLRPDRLLRLVRALRTLPFRVRIDLYTNGDRLSDALLSDLKSAGLDAIRFNLVAREFDTEPAERALRYFDETAVEVPVIPDRLAEMKDMVLRLDALGVPFLNIHELFACRENAARVAEQGYGSGGGASDVLLWEPVAAADEAALSLLLFALENTARLSVYYCSCRTQQDISRRGMQRRLRLTARAPRAGFHDALLIGGGPENRPPPKRRLSHCGDRNSPQT